MNISIREAQMGQDIQEHKELLGTSQVYIHFSTYLNDIRKAVDVVNKMEPEAIKRISDIIEDNTIGYNTLGQYLHPVMNAPTPEELKNVSAVIKLNMEAIKKAPESQTPDGFINKIADVIIHESEHKHDVETTGSSSESHPEAKEQEFMRKIEQSMPQQSFASIITAKASMRSHKEAVELFGEPVKGRVYTCELQSHSSGNIVTEDLKWIAEDDTDWVTADDNSEISNNWQVISWKEKPQKTNASISSRDIVVASPEFYQDIEELKKNMTPEDMKKFMEWKKKQKPTDEEKLIRDFIKEQRYGKKNKFVLDPYSPISSGKFWI